MPRIRITRLMLAVALMSVLALSLWQIGAQPSVLSAQSAGSLPRRVASGLMGASRAAATATSLQSGLVLIAGGFDSNYRYLPNAEVFDPINLRFKSLSPMTSARAGHTATLLPNGQVLIVGGVVCIKGACHKLATAEIFDPGPQQFFPVGEMSAARSAHTATLLTDGTVLVAGGIDEDVLSSAEIFDPVTGRFTPTASLNSQRFLHSATLLRDGRVLLAGGRGCVDECDDNAASNTAEIYDPVRRKFFAAGTMQEARIQHNATLLQDGRVLISGGRSCYGDCEADLTLQNAEIFDPVSTTFIAVGNMSVPRASHQAVALPDGQIFIYGGGWCSRRHGCAYPNTGDLFQPDTGKFVAATTGTVAGVNSVSALLPNDEVLIAGGRKGGTITKSADVFSIPN